MIGRRLIFALGCLAAAAVSVAIATHEAALGVVAFAALALFVIAPAADRVLWRQVTPRSIFETRRSGLC